MNRKVLLIEDEEKLRRILSLVLSDEGYRVETARNGEEGIAIWEKWHPEVVVTDLKMQPVDGAQVLTFGRLNFAEVPLVILTAFGSIDTAVAAMKYGAFDFLTKPVDHRQLLEVVGQALAAGKNERASLEALLGSSPEMKKVKKDIELFASTDSSVLISGESGTGKELAARAIHEASKRNAGPFIKVNCAAIPGELVESELFGHKKGAFTGALSNREGAFALADRGILFLDEIGDLPIGLQPKLLHAVEEKRITPVGSCMSMPVSVKILSATNRNLPAMVKASEFREDLFYRMNAVCLRMPPLRTRTGDIGELALFFLHQYCHEFKKPVLNISDDAMNLLAAYPWPGNVRELKNMMERLAITCRQADIRPRDLPETMTRQGAHPPLPPGPGPAALDMAAQEQFLLKTALEKSGWNQSNAARLLGITRSALRYRLQKYDIRRN
jgi:two-component system NtrC family response regulator